MTPLFSFFSSFSSPIYKLRRFHGKCLKCHFLAVNVRLHSIGLKSFWANSHTHFIHCPLIIFVRFFCIDVEGTWWKFSLFLIWPSQLFFSECQLFPCLTTLTLVGFTETITCFSSTLQGDPFIGGEKSWLINYVLFNSRAIPLKRRRHRYIQNWNKKTTASFVD